MRTRRRIDRECEIGEDLAEKEIRARITRDEVGVFADPAEPRLPRQRLLQHRRGIHAHPIAEGPDALRELLSERGERAAQDLVVVAPHGVARHVAEGAILQHRLRLA